MASLTAGDRALIQQSTGVAINASGFPEAGGLVPKIALDIAMDRQAGRLPAGQPITATYLKSLLRALPASLTASTGFTGRHGEPLPHSHAVSDGIAARDARSVVVVDEEFRHPRLAAIYDALDPDRSDLNAYVGMAAELGARRVVDVGCGTGTLAPLLADRGCDVVAVDPAAASLAVARGKPGVERVRWIEGDATSLPVTDRDLVTITGNAAQAIADPQQWAVTLTGIRAALQPGGHLAFETRDPAARGWERWTREVTYRTTEIPGVGAVTSWVELSALDWPLVSFRWTWIFHSDGATLTSDSTLRFRERDEVEADLHAAGCEVVDVRDAPDRPGLEFVFLARRAT